MDHIRAFWTWSLIGALVAGMPIVTQASAMGSAAGSLQVGEASSFRRRSSNSWGKFRWFTMSDTTGRPYALGLDLTGDTIGPLFSDPAYRYRRILFPAVSSIFGFSTEHLYWWE